MIADAERAAARPDVLVQTTYDAIKTAILSNRLRPGMKLNHRLLAEACGVSRTPVRESLERLHQEGYVTRIVNRGYFVAEMEAAEVVELYQTREALETYAIGLVIARTLSRQEFGILEDINQRYGALCKLELSRERLLVDREFHLTLAGFTGNAFLCGALGDIFDRLILKRRVEGFHGTGTQPHRDHVELLASIARGDRASGEDILRKHIRGACARFIEYLGVSTTGTQATGRGGKPLRRRREQEVLS